MDLETLLAKLSSPAQRGIRTLNFMKLEDFTRISEAQVRSLPGVGPKAVSLIREAMAERELTFQSWTEGKTVLTDPDIYPDDTELQRHLGGIKDVLDQMVDEFGRSSPPIALEWRYYTDGNSWLGKTTVGKKTIIWLAVCHHMFKTTFFFNTSALPLLEQSGLDDRYRSQWKDQSGDGRG